MFHDFSTIGITFEESKDPMREFGGFFVSRLDGRAVEAAKSQRAQLPPPVQGGKRSSSAQ